MKRTATFILSVLLCLTMAIPAMAWNAHVTNITDGDTFEATDSQGKKHRIRLWGIDAPESDQPGGQEATKHLTAIALGKKVDIQPILYDQWGRCIAIATREEGWTINGNMVRMGHAWSTTKRWKETQKTARAQHRGLWKSQEDPMKPSKWRKLHPPQKK